MNLSKETLQLVKEISVGILIFELVLSIVLAIICSVMGYPFPVILAGVLCGFAASELMLLHIAKTTEEAVDLMDENAAKKRTTITAILRKMIFIAAVMLVMFKIDGYMAMAMVFAVFGLKVGALMQPKVHKMLEQSAK